MKKIKISIFQQVSLGQYDSSSDIGKINAAHGDIAKLYTKGSNTLGRYVLIGETDVDIVELKPQELTQAQVDALRDELQEVRAENHRKEKALEDKISELLCLESK